ncbi:MAG TPA: serine/threonine-protein kinase [Streptosporangiaceae bacterium]|nr:serine/threonine-protein kinase [Streptosporangiaceae bacterium]
MVSELRPGDPQAIGPYRLVGELGQGGMGRVYLGVSPGGRPVAVKAIRAELAADPEFRSRFGREVASARRVSGVYTAQVVDADVDGPVAWMATAYVPGPSLAEAVDNHGPLPEASLLALAAGLAESLNAIHAAGVVHRDLKPSNVLLAEDGPRVIDFGISRAAESSTMLTQAGLVVGSPGFMSPEQAMGGEVGPPSDVFNLGAVLAFAATGEGPFGTGTTAALLYRVAHGEPDLARVPPRVRPLIERCLAKDQARRPSASGLLSEVGALQPDGNWLPDSLTRTFAASAVAGFGLSRSGFAPTSGPGYTPSNPGYAPSKPGRAPSNPGPATPGPVPAPSSGSSGSGSSGSGSSGSGYPPAGAGLAAYAAPAPGLTPTRTTAAGAGTPPHGYTSPTPPPGYGPTTPPLGYGSATSPLGNTPPTPPGGMYGPPGGGSQPRRRRVRPLMLALIIGVMLGAIGAAVFVVTSATKHTPARLNDTPAAVTSSAPAPSSSAPTSSSPTPTHRAPSSAPAYTPPPTHQASVTPTPTPTTSTTPTPTPTTSTSPTTSPTATTTTSPTATTSTPTATSASTPPSSGTTSTSGSTPASPPSSAPSS